MPAIVDHEARRAMLARLACDLIASRGVEGTTVQAVSAAAGFSTKIVTHYFSGKRELLLETYRFAARDSGEYAGAGQPAECADARAYALALLPTSPAMVRNWKVWFAFWGSAISDPEFSREQSEQITVAEARLAAIIGADPAYGDLPPRDQSRLAAEVMATLLGLAVRAIFDVARWPAERQRELLAARFPRAPAS